MVKFITKTNKVIKSRKVLHINIGGFHPLLFFWNNTLALTSTETAPVTANVPLFEITHHKDNVNDTINDSSDGNNPYPLCVFFYLCFHLIANSYMNISKSQDSTTQQKEMLKY